jgi:hypothetical protein
MTRLTKLCALVLLIAFGACGGQAFAARGMEVALQDDAMFIYGGYPGSLTRAQALGRATALGVSRIRANLSWAKVVAPAQARSRRVPKRVRYDWAPYDGLIDAAAAKGIRIQLTLTGFAPAYATKNHRIGVDAPSAKRFGQFAAAAGKHFRRRVDVYAIWNEPNIKPQLAPLNKTPSIYRGLYLAAYKAIRKADRKARILIGETNPYAIKGRAIAPIAFLRALTCVNKRYHRVRRCAPLTADGYAHHPYDFKHSPSYRYPGADNATIGTLSHLTAALSRLARAHVLRDRHGHALNVYLTEYGYYAKGSRRLPESKRASYLTKGFGIAYRNPRVKSTLVYLLVVPPGPSSFPMGLIKANGHLLKSYTSLRNWARKAHVKKRPKRIRLPKAPR